MVKNSPGNSGDADFDSWVGKTPGEGIATHFSILAWKLSWTEKPGGLQSMGVARIGHN